MTQFDNRPAHQRLDTFAVKHLVAILKELCSGSIGFDPYRDERTNSKDKLVSHIVANWTAEQIDAAHDAAKASYGNNPRRGRRGRRSQSFQPSSPSSSQTVEHKPVEINRQNVTDLEPVEPTPAPLSRDTADTSTQLAQLIAKLAASSLDEGKVASMIASAINKAMESIDNRIAESVLKTHVDQSLTSDVKVNVFKIQTPELKTVDMGLQHSKFGTLLKACNARLRDGHRLNIWLAGPAGSGKTSAASAVARALELPFFTNGALILGYQVTGFVDGSGRYHTTAFRQAWEHGGVYLWDEVDASAPNAVVELNTALANGSMTFPDSPTPVKRHADCVILAGANTFGRGATADYNGRAKQDEAFLSRFVPIDWPIDEAFEKALCADKAWADRVQACRAKIKSHGIRNHMVTPRATYYGEALIAAGFSANEAADMVLKQGATTEVWDKIKA